jgi:hypothetical protein
VINEDDEWSQTGRNILSPEALAKIAAVLERGCVILEHRFYRGCTAPYRLVFDDYEELLDYLKYNARPGDNFIAWSYDDLCRDDNSIAYGKYPDAIGRTPRRGAY